MQIDIKGLNKAEVLKALYDNSRPLGLGYVYFQPGGMSLTEAEQHLKDQKYFDYLKGRVMKVNLADDDLFIDLYDRDNGTGAGQRALQPLFDAHA